jgi:hypothetical protein
MAKWVLEVELDETGASDWDTAALAKRVREYLIWHKIAGEAFCELGKVTARKVGEE